MARGRNTFRRSAFERALRATMKRTKTVNAVTSLVGRETANEAGYCIHGAPVSDSDPSERTV